MNEYTETARLLLEKRGFQRARISNAQARDQNAWGTFSYGWHVQVGKEIERLRDEQPEEYAS